MLKVPKAFVETLPIQRQAFQAIFDRYFGEFGFCCFPFISEVK